MLLGHYAVAFGAKKAAPRVSLGVLVGAAVLLDLIWPVLVLTGEERVTIAPGATAFTPLTFDSYPWSHSLLTSLVWGALAGGLYYAWKKERRGALVVAALVVSHWLLDLLTHVPDLPLWPGGVKLGLGLWNSVPGTVAVELGLFAAGVWLYARAIGGVAGRWSLIALVAVLLVIYVANLFGPPPPDVNAIIWADLAQWVFVAWAAMADRGNAA